AVTVGLRRVRGRRAIVERIADAVAVGVRLAGVGRAAGVRAGADLRQITARARAAADDTGGDECVGRTVVAHAVAVLGDVAFPGYGPANGGTLDVGRTAGAGRVAALDQVAGARRGTADRAARDEPVGRACITHTVAALRHVADAGRRPADGGALGIRRAVGARAVAVLLEVAHAGREPARRAGRHDVIGGTVVGDTVAGLVDVADARCGPAHGRALGVGGAVVG